MNETCKKIVKNLLETEDVKDALEEHNWYYIFNTFIASFPALEMIGEFTDMLIKSGVDFCSYMKEVPSYAFYGSHLLKEADLRNAINLGSRCFRKSDLHTLYLSKNNLKNIGVGIFSKIAHDILIKWDGDYADWVKIRRNTNCFYNFDYTAIIRCNDGEFKETKVNA